MLRLLALVYLVSSVSFVDPTKIIGGSSAAAGQFPAAVSLQTAFRHHHFCGGVLVSDRIVISAAHCFAERPGPELTVAYVGSTDNSDGGTYYEVSRLVIHERYDPTSDLWHHTINTNDIALLELSEPVTFSEYVQPINLPQSYEVTPAGTKVNALGWGTISFPDKDYPDDLQYLELQVIGNDECASRLGIDVPITQLCVGGEDGYGTCHGDSGGPLISGDTVIGIVSWGTPCAIGDPDVFTRVSRFIDWIEENSSA